MTLEPNAPVLAEVALLIMFTSILALSLFYQELKTYIKVRVLRKSKKPATTTLKMAEFLAAANKQNSPMLLLMHNKEIGKNNLVMLGDSFELIRAIADMTDNDQEANEFMQIVCKYYLAKLETKGPAQ